MDGVLDATVNTGDGVLDAAANKGDGAINNIDDVLATTTIATTATTAPTTTMTTWDVKPNQDASLPWTARRRPPRRGRREAAVSQGIADDLDEGWIITGAGKITGGRRRGRTAKQGPGQVNDQASSNYTVRSHWADLFDSDE